MNPTEERVPRALREVWEWRESINREFADMPTDEALKRILLNARRVAEEMGFQLQPQSPVSAVDSR